LTPMKSFAMAICVGTLALIPLQADQSDKKTIITIDAPMQVPTMTLQPGTYTLKLLESTSNRHVVTIWDQDGMKLVTTVMAIPNYRLKPTGDSKFTLWEAPVNQPQALRSWFYPGDNFGQEFAYPRAKADEISLMTKEQVPALSAEDQMKFGTATQSSASAETAQVTTAVPSARNETTVAAAVVAEPTPPEPTPAPKAAADPAPAAAPVAATVASAEAPQEPSVQTAPVPANMPATASHWRELLLIGVAMAIVGLSTFFTQKERA